MFGKVSLIQYLVSQIRSLIKSSICSVMTGQAQAIPALREDGIDPHRVEEGCDSIRTPAILDQALSEAVRGRAGRRMRARGPSEGGQCGVAVPGAIENFAESQPARAVFRKVFEPRQQRIARLQQLDRALKQRCRGHPP